MTAFPPYRQRRFALLIAALLMLSNALVTAHAFGEVDHAVKDGCQLLHQFERQQTSPVDIPHDAKDTRRHVAPADEAVGENVLCQVRHFQPRAPPFV